MKGQIPMVLIGVDEAQRASCGGLLVTLVPAVFH